MTPEQWLVFRYTPAALFSLKMSRATSTAGKTLLTPTPYAVKMAFLDAALRHGLTNDPEALVRELAKAAVRIGVPQHACLTGTIQNVRQETREAERKRHPELPPYRTNIAMREFVYYRGSLQLAIAGAPELEALLLQAAPAINYLGKRGSFVQYRGYTRLAELASSFTRPAGAEGSWGHRAILDDFGKGATFEALNSFSATEIRRGVHRTFVETIVPLAVHNVGVGFVHYCAPGAER